MLNRPNHGLRVLAWLSGLVLLVSLALIVVTGVQRVTDVGRALEAKGWARTVGATGRQRDQFTARCLVDGRCGQVFASVWSRSMPEWMLFGPLVGLVGLVAVRVARNRAPRKDPGEARWATREDMKPYLGDKPGDGRVGYMGLLESRHVVRLPESLRCAHTLVIGGTGAGKTTRYVNPNLLLDARDGSSAVVFDLKYPDPRSGFLETINYFKAWGRNVYPFTPFDPDSVRVPLIAGINTVQDALGVAEAFRPFGGQDDDGGAAFYKNNERQLLAGLVLAVAQEPNPSLKRIFDLLGGGSEQLKEYAKARPYLKPILGTLLELRGDVLTGLATGLMGDLLPFTNPNLDRATSQGEGQRLDLEALCTKPGFLYIGIPQEDIQGGQGQVLLRLIKRVLDKAILSASGRNGGRLPVHLSIYLDEFPSFGPLPNVAENLATMRSRRVAYHIAMQNLAQGQAIYGKEEFAGMINNNFAQMVVFPRSLRLEDAQFFAEVFGETTVIEESVGRMITGGILGPNPLGEVRRSLSIKAAKRFLLSAEAMRTFPDGNAVIETIGSPPAVVRLPRLDERDNPYRRLFEKIKRTYPTPQLRKPGVGTVPAAPSLASAFTLAQSGPAKNPLAEAFRDWLEGLLEGGTPLRAEFDGDKPAHLEIERRDLPSLPDETPEWIAKGWLEEADTTVAVPRLGLSRVARLHKAISQQDARWTVLRWVADSAEHLENHPRRLEAEAAGRALPAVGVWRPGTVLIQPDDAVTLLGSSASKPQRATLGGAEAMLVPVPLSGEVSSGLSKPAAKPSGLGHKVARPNPARPAPPARAKPSAPTGRDPVRAAPNAESEGHAPKPLTEPPAPKPRPLNALLTEPRVSKPLVPSPPRAERVPEAQASSSAPEPKPAEAVPRPPKLGASTPRKLESAKPEFAKPEPLATRQAATAATARAPAGRDALPDLESALTAEAAPEHAHNPTESENASRVVGMTPSPSRPQ